LHELESESSGPLAAGIEESSHVAEGVEEKINPQREGSKAKVYQVRQVRATMLKYKLGGPT